MNQTDNLIMKLGIKIFIPILIVGSLLLAFQNCGKYPYNEKQSSTSLTLEMRTYYWVEEGYTCITLAGDSIESFRDSLYFLDGNVCFTGNLCTQKVNCQPWPSDLIVEEDLNSVLYKGRVYLYMKTPPFDF